VSAGDGKSRPGSPAGRKQRPGRTEGPAGPKGRPSARKTTAGAGPAAPPAPASSGPKLAGAGAAERLHDTDLVRVLGPEGELLPGATSTIPDERLLRIHDTLHLVRALDERMIRLQRQGRAGFYGACTGEEAAVLGSVAALRDSDWIVPALRQGPAMLFRGFPLVPYVAQVLGNSGDVLKARQMPSHHAAREVHQVSWGSCIANQLLQSVGIARAMRLRGHDSICIGYVGDGGTSEGDFHVAMNLAATWKVPLILFCQNNQWAISVPLDAQTRVTRLADKAAAYGLPGVRVDGNDALAVYQVVSEAAARARAGEGPTFVEALTYRVGAHSTSDDPSRYRDESVTERWRERDPLARLERHLAATGLRGAADVARLRERCVAEVDSAVNAVEALPPVGVETLITDVFAQVPAELERQWRAWGSLPRALPRA